MKFGDHTAREGLPGDLRRAVGNPVDHQLGIAWLIERDVFVDLDQMLDGIAGPVNIHPVKPNRFDSYRLKGHFGHHFTQATQKTRDFKEKYEELSIAYSLSQVFSPKQKELFMKKLKVEMLNKTEKDYYSRTVKKKVAALASTDVHRLAQRLMEM